MKNRAGASGELFVAQAAPDIPMAGKAGMPGLDIQSWRGARGLPAAFIDRDFARSRELPRIANFEPPGSNRLRAQAGVNTASESPTAT